MRDVDTLITTLSAHMRKKLVENAHKPHWSKETVEALFVGLHQEKKEFVEAIHDPKSTADQVWDEAADLCNYVAFLADVVSREKTNDCPRADGEVGELNEFVWEGTDEKVGS